MRKQAKKVSVIYVRKSTDEVGLQENSLTIQEEACREFCKTTGIEVLGVFQDKVSGTTPFSDKTPGLVQAVEAAIAAKATLVCHRSDRLSRTISRLYEVKSVLAKAGCQVVFADEGFQVEDEFSQMREVLVALQSQMTVSLLRRRVRESLKSLRSKGKKYTRIAPYGMRWEGDEMVADEQEKLTIQRVKELGASGISAYAVVRALTAEGYKNRKGETFCHMTVRSILKAA